MLDRAELLRIIDEAYALRKAGDKDALAACWAADATYEMAGAETILPPSVPVGPGGASATVSALIDLFEFHELERVQAIVEGNRAAILWRLTVSMAGKPPVTTALHDLWQVDEDGKLASLHQFVDTALLKDLLS